MDQQQPRPTNSNPSQGWLPTSDPSPGGGPPTSELSHGGLASFDQSRGCAEPLAADRLARVQWLISELRHRAAECDDQQEQTNLRRSADSLVRLATALRS